jgi:hypothetical protein
MITYNWTISSLEVAPKDENNLVDVVKTVHCRYKATDGEYTKERYGTYSCPQPSETDFTAYPDLTEADVISWLETGLDIPAMQQSLASQIEDLRNPPIVSLPLPWSNLEA